MVAQTCAAWQTAKASSIVRCAVQAFMCLLDGVRHFRTTTQDLARHHGAQGRMHEQLALIGNAEFAAAEEGGVNINLADVVQHAAVQDFVQAGGRQCALLAHCHSGGGDCTCMLEDVAVTVA